MTALSATPSADPILRRVGRLLGWLSLFATLALLSPGVVATANADELATDSGPSCRASVQADNEMAFQLAQMVERLRSQLADGDGGSTGEIRSLNTRGYNYGVSAAPVRDERR